MLNDSLKLLLSITLNDVQISGSKQIPLPCCSSETLHPECLPVIVDADDPRYGGFLSCMPYARTTVAPRPFCALGPREQANQATSYLDASVIYGSTPNRGNILRTFRDGILTDLTVRRKFQNMDKPHPCFRSCQLEHQ